MRSCLRPAFLLVLLCCASEAFAQKFSESVNSYVHSVPGHGRDFWFTPTENDVDQAGKYIRVYVTVSDSTVVHIEYAGQKLASSAIPKQPLTINIPLATEIKSSGIIEDKGIHVYSLDADLVVYLMNHVPYTSDGMYCIPTSSLGTDYVVAGYGALFEGFGSYTFDYPSEFTITATEDNTSVTITPSCDLRQATAFPNIDTTHKYSAGVPFTVILSRGQAVQFQSAKATSVDGFDVTGTLVHATAPVTVVGGSMCPNIPPDYPYCDYVTDMMLPLNLWGKEYYTTNFAQPQGMLGHNFGLYLIVSSKPHQMIYRADSLTGVHEECIIDNKYGTYWAEESGANKWFSDTTFMLVQYMNSSSYPDYNNGNGDPAEVVINPVENFSYTVQFQTAQNVSSQSTYQQYASIFYKSADNAARIDGEKINTYPHQAIDDTFSVATFSTSAAGNHIVTSSKGVGVTVYGYGYDESYAWAGALGAGNRDTIQVKGDFVPPVVIFDTDHNCINASVSDSGSGLGQITLGTTSNMDLAIDPFFIPNSGQKHTTVSACVKDTTASGSATYTVTDSAGNRSIVEIDYTRDYVPGFAVSTLSFDTVLVGTQKTLPILFVTDTSAELPITISSISINDTAFFFNAALPANKLPVTLLRRTTDTFWVTFRPREAKTYSATATVNSSNATAHLAGLTGIGYTLGSAVNTQPLTPLRAQLFVDANNALTLSYSLSEASNIDLGIYSVLGDQVYHFSNGYRSAGSHSESLDLNSLANGEYLWRFESGTNMVSGKLSIQH